MKKLIELETKIGITFKNKDLLLNAFVHRSYLNENKKFYLDSNEKLEFLGDSVLSLISSIYLYKNYPKLHEGDYTNIKAKTVQTESLYDASADLNLKNYLLLSRGEKSGKNQIGKSILADCFEALIGAIFLDQGFNIAFDFVIKFLFKDKVNYLVKNNLFNSPKNKLQEFYQNKYKKLPEYKVIKQTGPEHNKNYLVGLFFEEIEISRGEGKSKKEAEEKAALTALQKLNYKV